MKKSSDSARFAAAARSPSLVASGPENRERTPSPTSRRLFFALWPDDAVVAELTEWAQRAQEACNGRRMRADTLHMTLAFLGTVAVDRIPVLAEMLQGRRWPGGVLSLDRVGRFGGPKIVWAGSSEPSPWLDAMHVALWRALSYQGFKEPDEPFRAHVSLLRNAGAGDLSAVVGSRPVIWTPDRLVLVASAPRGSGSYYEVIAECGVTPAY
ncbi:MAG TPA: RNA 2',3'-cyclic phosphodiesterase [Castellaniella sp.]|uniref:RNA 2',3'-cyclic phosphodiesterase n=1 Tax=Castellaniella sp. TaxID=1955812 RepID=UPI002F251CFE